MESLDLFTIPDWNGPGPRVQSPDSRSVLMGVPRTSNKAWEE
jgi:hypothetical protein